MADGITYGFSLNLNNEDLLDSYSVTSKFVTQSTQGLFRHVQNIGTAVAGELVDMGDIVEPRMGIFSNLSEVVEDEYNFIELGIRDILGDFYPFLKLSPGKQAGPMWLGTSISEITKKLYARATVDTQMFYIIYDK